MANRAAHTRSSSVGVQPGFDWARGSGGATISGALVWAQAVKSVDTDVLSKTDSRYENNVAEYLLQHGYIGVVVRSMTVKSNERTPVQLPD